MATNRFHPRHGMAPGVVASATAYASSGMEPASHRGLPSPWLTFLVSVDGPVRVSGTVAERAVFDPTAATSYDVMVAGLHPVAAVVEQPARQAGVQLARSRGTARIEDVARQVALSPRQLRVLVEREVGLSPKQVARGFRFDATVEGLTSGRPLAEVAVATGYADQAHLDREFRQMVGCSPTAWLHEERRNIQDGGHRNRPESSS